MSLVDVSDVAAHQVGVAFVAQAVSPAFSDSRILPEETDAGGKVSVSFEIDATGETIVQ